MSQNRWPSLALDVGSSDDALSPLYGAGFYYKTFMGPDLRQELGLEEPLRSNRRLAAGSGPCRRTDTLYFDHCDVLIVGAGPAGLRAASGANVDVCDENRTTLGGR